MNVNELFDSIQATILFATDAAGNRRAVQLPMELWEEIVTLLEDTEAEDEARWDELFAKHPEVLERLADEAEAEIKAGRTEELVPEAGEEGRGGC